MAIFRTRAKPKPKVKGNAPTRATPNPNAPKPAPVPTNRKVKPDDTTGGPENRQKVSTKDDTPDTYAKRRKEAQDKAEKSKNNPAAWAAVGIPLAAAAGLISAALAQFASTDGAEIKFTQIKPETNADSWVPGSSLFQTRNLEFTWEYTKNPKNPLAIPSAVRITKGDTIDIHDLPEFPFNNGQVTVLKTKGDNVFVIDPKMDVSNVFIENKGTGAIHTSFENQLDQNVKDASTAIGDMAQNALDGLFPHLGTIVFVIIIIILCVLFFTVFLKSKPQPQVSN